MNGTRPCLLLLGLSLASVDGACADGKNSGKGAPPPSASKPALSPLRPQPMRGPFSSLGAFCATLKPAPVRCLTDAPDPEGSGFAALREAAAPYRAVRLFGAGDTAWYAFYLGIQTERGWYVQDVIEAAPDAKVRDLSLDKSAPALGPLVRLRLCGANLMPTAPGSERTIQMCFEQLLLCGLGKTGAPNCLPSLRVANTVCKEYDGSQAMPPWDWQIQATLKGGKQLELTVQGSPDFTAPTKHLGTHVLEFP